MSMSMSVAMLVMAQTDVSDDCVKTVVIACTPIYIRVNMFLSQAKLKAFVSIIGRLIYA